MILPNVIVSTGYIWLPSRINPQKEKETDLFYVTSNAWHEKIKSPPLKKPMKFMICNSVLVIFNT